MLKSYKYRIYPTKEQSVLLEKHFGANRFIYNLALETKIAAYNSNKINISNYELHKQLTDLKKEYSWLKEINSQSLQQSITNLDDAYKLFFRGVSNFPKFKNKSSKQSFTIPQFISIKNNKLIIPKFKEGFNIILHRPIKGEIRQATISKTSSGKYFASILCETNDIVKLKKHIQENTTIGIDLGIKSFIVTSNGDEIDNPKFFNKLQSKLKYLQRKYSQNKGKRTKIKLAKVHEKIANQRKDFSHKESFKLVSENQTIAIEDLNVKGMLKNHSLAKSISDVGWSMFTKMLEYKSKWYGVNLLKIDRFEPSSKTCSNCGTVNKELTLKDREWDCVKCNTQHKRDLNAAINIKSFALKNYVSGMDTKIRNELSTIVEVMTSEVIL